MMNESPARASSGDAGAALRALLIEARFAQAVHLARGGHYAEAENVLASVAQEGDQAPTRLDLLARIRAQQGKLLEAEALWTQAAQLAPGNGAFQSGLERIAALQNRPLRAARMFFVVIALLILLTAAGLAWKVSRELDAVRSMVAELKEKGPTGAASQQAGVPLPQEQFQVGGISLREEQNALVATFEAGLFSRGSVLSASSGKLLTEFGRKLEEQGGKFSVEITGCTDDSPMPAGSRYRDNSALGMARAVAVAEHLRRTTKFPERLLLVRGGGEASAPYPNDSPASRARNRTVIIRIARVE